MGEGRVGVGVTGRCPRMRNLYETKKVHPFHEFFSYDYNEKISTVQLKVHLTDTPIIPFIESYFYIDMSTKIGNHL